MKKRTGRWLTVLCALLCLTLSAVAVPTGLATAQALPTEGETLFDDFEDYTQTDYDNTLLYSTQGAHGICQAGQPISGAGRKSLKIGSLPTASDAINFWTRHNFDVGRQDQTGAKYVKLYVKNLNDQAAELGFYVTDVKDNDEKKQEHWGLAWNSKLLLVDSQGNESLTVCDAGTYVKFPAGFEGAVYFTLDKSTLEVPGWLHNESGYVNGDYKNGEIDLGRIFKVSPGIPRGQKDSAFLIDDIYFGTGDWVANKIAALADNTEVRVTDVVRPTDDSLSVDYNAKTITATASLTLGGLKDKFFLDSGWSIRVTDPDGFAVEDVEAVLEPDVNVAFSDGTTTFVFRYTVQADQKLRVGCGSRLGTVAVWPAVLCLALASVVGIRKKSYEKD